MLDPDIEVSTEDQPLLINDKSKAIKFQRATNPQPNYRRNNRRCHFFKWCCIGTFISIFVFFIINLIIYSAYLRDQIHLSFTDSTSNNLTVTWISFNNYDKSNVNLEYIKSDNSNNRTFITPISSIFGSNVDITRYVYRAELNDLEYNCSYNYFINNDVYRAGPFTFNVPEENKHTNKALFFGNMGFFNAYTRECIINESLLKEYDFLFHLGDIAYDLDTYLGFIGDLFMTSIQKVASSIPYMTIPGNHESYNNFSSYINRFSMPNYTEFKNLYYTIEKPPLKMINFNTEAYHFLSMEPTLESQTNFIISELNNTNRTKFPWLIVTGHRPMYCSTGDSHDCTNWQTDKVRVALEQYFYEYNVTAYISAHEHSYQRICPIYNGTCQKHFKNFSYFKESDLDYPIHLITGAAGNIEGGSKDVSTNWQEVLFDGPSFGVLETDYTAFRWTEYSVDSNNGPYIIDDFTISR
jgi:acid phosphatase type 7